MNQTAVMTGKYLIGSDVDLLREPVTCRTEGSADVTSFHHLHQVSDDLKWKSNTKTHTHTHPYTYHINIFKSDISIPTRILKNRG